MVPLCKLFVFGPSNNLERKITPFLFLVTYKKKESISFIFLVITNLQSRKQKLH